MMSLFLIMYTANIAVITAFIEYDLRYYTEQYYHPGCWPGTETADNGDYLIEQNIEFSLECQPGYTRPFGSKSAWHCNSSALRPNYFMMKNNDSTYIPTSCVEERLPSRIYLDLEVTVRIQHIQECDNEPVFSSEILNVMVEDHAFFVNSEPIMQECKLLFDTESHLIEVMTSYTFRMFHHPVADKLTSRILIMARDTLRMKAVEFMTMFMKKEAKQINYTLGQDNEFHSGECSEGSLVEKTENVFATTIAMCRMCPPGRFMDKELMQCLPCLAGYTDVPGAMQCKNCPVIMPSADRAAQSLEGCYVDVDEQPDFSETLREGVFFFIIFHSIFLGVILLRFRNIHTL